MVPNETPRGQARMSVSVTPMTIENEVEQISKFMDELDLQLKQSNNSFFGTRLSIADLLYFWEISTLQHLLKREIVVPNTDLATWYHESMRSRPEI